MHLCITYITNYVQTPTHKKSYHCHAMNIYSTSSFHRGVKHPDDSRVKTTRAIHVSSKGYFCAAPNVNASNSGLADKEIYELGTGKTRCWNCILWNLVSLLTGDILSYFRSGNPSSLNVGTLMVNEWVNEFENRVGC